MKVLLGQLFCALLILTSISTFAATRYVDLNSPAPAPPYNSWVIAATNIQDAIDAAGPGDEVLVTNGVYQTGGRVVSPGLLTNRVAVTKPVAVRSVNGAGVTFIEGYRVPGTDLGTNAVRCVYLTNGAVLNGFTLTNGGTFTGSGNSANYSGGGVRCESTNAMVLNCVLVRNAAADGGGAYSGTLSNCFVLQNTATGSGGGAQNSALRDCKIQGNRAGVLGGGASAGTLVNCTIVNNNAASGGGSWNANVINSAVYGNYATSGGGLHSGSASNCTIVANSAAEGGGAFSFGGSMRLRNCIIYYNQAIADANAASYLDLINCCVTPASGVASIISEPQLASLFRLSSASPCRTNGSAAYASGTDIDGETWGNPPAIGCDQYVSGSITGTLAVVMQANFTNVAVGAAIRFLGLIDGRVDASRWEFDDGTVVSNRPVVLHKWTSAGSRQVVLRAFNETYPEGISVTSAVQIVTQPTHYVRSNNPAQAFPYTSWATAATSIQNAVDAASAVPGSLVLVSNGVYATGARLHMGLNNRLVVTNQVVVRSVNGYDVTRVVGQGTATINPLRVVYLGDGAVLSGFTVSNGGTQVESGGVLVTYDSGGGVFGESAASIVTNCLITGNAAGQGGGVCGGTIVNSAIIANSTYNNLGYGGGVASSRLDQCVIRNNTSRYGGGGIYGGNLNNCLVVSNSTSTGGGGGEYSYLNNCTVVGNTGGNGGGTLFSSLTNCIVQFNRFAINNPNDVSFYGTTPSRPVYIYNSSIGYMNGSAAVSIGNFATAPAFVNPADGDFRLQPNSLGINDGTNIYVTSTMDLDGNPRIVGGAVDVGAYEHQSPDFQVPYQWLWQYGLAANGSSDSADADGDDMSNYGEWRSGTIPTNAASALRLFPPSEGGSGVLVSWQGVGLKTYWLERAEELSGASPFQTMATDLIGTAGTNTFTDTSATNGGPYFYRIGVN